jgi:UDP-N-acetylmuramoyl-L-alanyl-D-glutamate--2,6-diaminopimelate ligase
MRLQELLKKMLRSGACVLPFPGLSKGSLDAEIFRLSLDSRRVQVGDCFLAFPGFASDGRNYVEAAVAAGASAVIYESKGASEFSVPVPTIPVLNLAEKIGDIASFFYQNPGESLHIVGITGTNGKTSISHALAQAYELLGKKAAVMGTLGVGPLTHLQKTGMTTPDAICVQKSLAQMRETSVDYLAMEVSSHALAQHRVVGCPFKTAVYTQLSPDHLDFHLSMEDYARSKERLFQFKGLEHAILNADDPWGMRWIEKYRKELPIIAYTMKETLLEVPLVRCEFFSTLSDGSGYRVQLSTPWGKGECDLHLLGEYNITNCLALIAVLGAQGFSWSSILAILPKIKAVPGRMQWFRHRSGAAVVVDFAHTPDALDQVLKTLRSLCQGRLHCVFGCGGDRDRSKRENMGKIAAKWADRILITNDNPRTEDPQVIAQAIREGCGDHCSVNIELNREKAIQSALTAVGKYDIILVAGKGHETEQIIGNRVFPFSDIDYVRSLCF